MSSTATITHLNRKTVQCNRCGVKRTCLGSGLDPSQLGLKGDAKGPPRLFQRGDHVFRMGDRFYSLYVIRAGAVKTYMMSEGGEEQIIGFYGPGETIGFDAIVDGRHHCHAAALDTSSVCAVPFEAVSKLCERSPALIRALMKGISGETMRLADMLLLGKKPAEQRLASFLLSQSDSQCQRGYSAKVFTLSMTRTDIAKYLGLTLETVSRVLTRLESQGLVSRDRKNIRINSLHGLRCLATESVGQPSAGIVCRKVS